MLAAAGASQAGLDPSMMDHPGEACLLLELVGPKIDWDDFLAGCDQRDQRIAQMKLEGCPQTEIAEALGVSAPAICQRLRALRRRWDTQAVA